MKLRYLLPLLTLALALVFPARAENNVAPPGYTALFDGKTLSGWYGWSTEDPNDLWKLSPDEQTEYKKKSIEGGLTDKKGNPANDNINAHWRVENGELVNDGHGLYMTTNKDYGDFELRLEYKALPDGDSGVYLRGVPQVQIWDSTKGDPRGLGQDKGSGGLWNNSKGAPGKDPSKKMDKPFGEWNTLKIRMIGERVTVVFNGETVVDNSVLRISSPMKRPAISPGASSRPRTPARRRKCRTATCAIRFSPKGRSNCRRTAVRSAGGTFTSTRSPRMKQTRNCAQGVGVTAAWSWSMARI